MDAPPTNSRDYNDTLRKISNSLENALETFGPASRQYQAVLQILKECLHDIEKEKQTSAQEDVVDSDMLSLAMGYLEIK
ncbi:hypothetical protein N7456_012852 [Penicillium angulare]|uniref:Uncharacterized protein n=1 Tax=Penicillium angulare TaxID=116970 RepID=A0A9W9EKK1_9EURO|nr:hypothetical protein N7456_012852 [Penicillium angulare]